MSNMKEIQIYVNREWKRPLEFDSHFTTCKELLKWILGFHETSKQL